MKIKLEDIVLLLLILGIVTVALWMLHGSPTTDSALITIAVFIASSELLIWRKIFSMDKNTAVSFVNLKKDIGELKSLIKVK